MKGCTKMVLGVKSSELQFAKNVRVRWLVGKYWQVQTDSLRLVAPDPVQWVSLLFPFILISVENRIRNVMELTLLHFAVFNFVYKLHWKNCTCHLCNLLHNHWNTALSSLRFWCQKLGTSGRFRCSMLRFIVYKFLNMLSYSGNIMCVCIHTYTHYNIHQICLESHLLNYDYTQGK